MGFNFITSGIEETTISASAGQTGGDVYVEARYGVSGGNADFNSIHSPEEISKISLEPVLDEAADEKNSRKSEKNIMVR